MLSLDPVARKTGEAETEQQWIRISVADNGPGIDPVIAERIFEPYFTTKPSGKGTGMGLAVVHGIVDQHGGQIEVKSTPGQGTIVHVFFPEVPGDETLAPRRESPALVGGDESILVVDDEQMVADYLKEFLERFGYRVTVCNDGNSALAVFTRNPDAFDLVITDQTMPGKTGLDMARTLLALRPGLPIILCSGYSSTLSPERVAQAGIRKIMMKPVSLHDLAPAIRSIFDPP